MHKVVFINLSIFNIFTNNFIFLQKPINDKEYINYLSFSVVLSIAYSSCPFCILSLSAFNSYYYFWTRWLIWFLILTDLSISNCSYSCYSIFSISTWTIWASMKLFYLDSTSLWFFKSNSLLLSLLFLGNPSSNSLRYWSLSSSCLWIKSYSIF